MHRRNFLIRAGGGMIFLSAALDPALAARRATDRIGMGTVIFRSRFEQTKAGDVTDSRPLTLLQVPAYYRERFGVSKLEFWSNHFESLDAVYLKELRARVKAAQAELINVQVDASYDLASRDEAERERSLETVRNWIDAAALLGSQAVRVNPGKAGGSLEQSIVSMKQVNEYCLGKRLPLLTENHFGIEMNPAVHLQIREAAGPHNFYTLPDFGNYPVESMWESLTQILPFAYVVSAKAMNFNARAEHVSYDFDRCVQLCERAGFRGIYLVEQWSRQDQDLDTEKIADWLLDRVRANI